MKESLLDRIEEKTSVDRNTIINLAKKLQSGNYKDENTLRSIIHELSEITGREVSTQKEDKIISMIVNDKVPKDIEKYV